MINLLSFGLWLPDVKLHLKDLINKKVPRELIKLYEVIVKWTRESCDIRKIDSSQYGAVKGGSATHALLNILQPIFKAVDDSGKYARILLIDFAKAFDHISHPIALEKMTSNGVPEIFVKWIRGFLCERRQWVKVGQSALSNWVTINGGVPQGTLCGPEVFVHMVSDLQTDIPGVKFVDDTTLVEICAAGQEPKMQQALNDICKWCDKNKLYLNVSKTKELVINFSKLVPNPPCLEVQGKGIRRVAEAKLLGVALSDSLKWNTHVENIYNKAAKRLHFIRQLKRSGVSQSDLCRVYCTIVRPVVEYSCPVWCTGLSCEMRNLLESLQRRVCRIYMLPPVRNSKYELRHSSAYPLPKCRTSRYKNSFVPWCLYNLQ